MRCPVATGPNAIPVSLERGNRLLNAVEKSKMSDEDVQGTQPPPETWFESGAVPMRSEEAPCEKTDSNGKFAEATEEDCRPEAIETMPHWWRETSAKESCNQGGALRYVGATAVLRVELAGSSCEALLEIGASRSFISPKTVERLQLRSDKLRTYMNDQWCELPVVRTGKETLQGDSHIVAPPKTSAEQAYDILAKQLADMSAEEAAIFLRPPPKRYKSHAKTKAKARITSLVRQAAADADSHCMVCILSWLSPTLARQWH
ncbi:hypothetical protein, conserved [Eimeria necatrix]|uniref:Uncharacterized protein n=1 Tax=Eimeria necatrix TaxID=51315 RepID=U6MQS7_9EIME|nr:hypothetical protein, conserved [Eimeria necatrix]CDJ66527.1 hypothetical protein, conserved [Eimeria necatrix]